MNGDSRWRSIWNKEKALDKNISLQQALIFADGFDSGAGKIEENEWITYVNSIERLLIKDRDREKKTRIYEVGCGSGAFLYALYTKGYAVGGIDYSERLIEIARTAMPEGDFTCGEATDIPERVQADYVLSNSVFQYFEDLEYAGRVFDAISARAEKGVAILDVPDAALKEQSEAARRGAMPAGEYERKYAGLEHRYYERDWFRQQAARYGMAAEFHSQAELFTSYGNTPFRFTVVMRRA